MAISFSPKRRALFTAVLLVLAFIVYRTSGLGDVTQETLRSLGSTAWAGVVIVLSMAGAWAFALPASVFFFLTPLVYDPLPSAVIIMLGSSLGALAGYLAARNISGAWSEKFRGHRVTQFLARHSTFSSLFAIRIVPGSPHGFINYGAGLVEVPLARFLVATVIATAIKGFIYSVAVHSATEAQSLTDALNWESVVALFGLGLLAVGGRIIKTRWLRSETE